MPILTPHEGACTPASERAAPPSAPVGCFLCHDTVPRWGCLCLSTDCHLLVAARGSRTRGRPVTARADPLGGAESAAVGAGCEGRRWAEAVRRRAEQRGRCWGQVERVWLGHHQLGDTGRGVWGIFVLNCHPDSGACGHGWTGIPGADRPGHVPIPSPARTQRSIRSHNAWLRMPALPLTVCLSFLTCKLANTAVSLRVVEVTA